MKRNIFTGLTESQKAAGWHEVIVDFETFYAPAIWYTLKKLSTEEYVRDPRFQVLAVSIAIDDQ